MAPRAFTNSGMQVEPFDVRVYSDGRDRPLMVINLGHGRRSDPGAVGTNPEAELVEYSGLTHARIAVQRGYDVIVTRGDEITGQTRQNLTRSDIAYETRAEQYVSHHADWGATNNRQVRLYSHRSGDPASHALVLAMKNELNTRLEGAHPYFTDGDPKRPLAQSFRKGFPEIERGEFRSGTAAMLIEVADLLLKAQDAKGDAGATPDGNGRILDPHARELLFNHIVTASISALPEKWQKDKSWQQSAGTIYLDYEKEGKSPLIYHQLDIEGKVVTPDELQAKALVKAGEALTALNTQIERNVHMAGFGIPITNLRDSVSRIQRSLNDAGFPVGPEDGVDGERTTAGMRRLTELLHQIPGEVTDEKARFLVRAEKGFPAEAKCLAEGRFPCAEAGHDAKVANVKTTVADDGGTAKDAKQNRL